VQSIGRAEHGKERPYTKISNYLINDMDLDFEARGFMAYLLAKFDDFSINIPCITRETRLSRSRIYRILSRLEKAGYIYRSIEKYHDELGKFSTSSNYLIFEDRDHRQELIDKLKGKTQ